MSFLRRAKHLLSLYKVLPKKRWGQSFLVDKALLKRMIFYASINKESVVLEIGAGLGFLTQALSKVCKRVIAVEVDSKLVKILRDQLRDLQNVKLIEGNVLSVSVPSFDKVVSFPPYNISSPLLFWLLEKEFDCAVLVFQKEFVERLIAPLGSKGYGRLTVITSYLTDVELLDFVPRNRFYPPPNVDSVIIRLKPKDKPTFPVDERKPFFKLVKTLFTQRNKKVRNATISFLRMLGIKGENAAVLADSLPFHNKRVRELAPEEFRILSDEMIRKNLKFQKSP